MKYVSKDVLNQIKIVWWVSKLTFFKNRNLLCCGSVLVVQVFVLWELSEWKVFFKMLMLLLCSTYLHIFTLKCMNIVFCITYIFTYMYGSSTYLHIFTSKCMNIFFCITYIITYRCMLLSIFIMLNSMNSSRIQFSMLSGFKKDLRIHTHD